MPENLHNKALRAFKNIQNDNWKFVICLQQNKDKRILFWELGTGMNTPGIIKYSFWKMTAQQPQAKYACANLGEAFAPKELEERAICINEDIDAVLNRLAEN